MSVIICYSTCWGCKFGQCFERPTPHPWWDQEDVEYSKEAGLPAPVGNCACPCGRSGDE